MAREYFAGCTVEFVPTVAMFALIVKLVDFLRYLRAGDLNGVLTQLSTWIGGVVVVLLVAQTAWADGIEVGDRPLSILDFWSQLFVGLTVASTASLVKDTLKSVDNSNTSKIPTLLPAGPKATRRSHTGVAQDEVG